jgi:hypothetical protein
MKLAEQVLVSMGEDLSLTKELGKIRAEIKKKGISKTDLLNFYDTTRNLLGKHPKSKSKIKKLQNEIKALLHK